MKKSTIYIIWCMSLMVLVGLGSCRNRTPYVYQGFPKEYTLCWENQYGRCYDSVPYNVVAVDLYSDGLTLNAKHLMQGTGYNLFLSDIFVDTDAASGSSQLPAGKYHSDTTALPYTFLPGKDYEGYPHGMYILHIEEDKITGIQVIDSGYMVVRDTTDGLRDLQFTLYYKNAYGYTTTYTTHFQGELTPWAKQ